jgi:hypothetical protein
MRQKFTPTKSFPPGAGLTSGGGPESTEAPPASEFAPPELFVPLEDEDEPPDPEVVVPPVLPDPAPVVPDPLALPSSPPVAVDDWFEFDEHASTPTQPAANATIAWTILTRMLERLIKRLWLATSSQRNMGSACNS